MRKCAIIHTAVERGNAASSGFDLNSQESFPKWRNALGHHIASTVDTNGTMLKEDAEWFRLWWIALHYEVRMDS